MDSIFLTQLVVSVLVGGLFVAFQTWLAEKVPQRIAGLVISIPSTVAVALIFMAITVSPEAVASIVPVIPVSLGGGLIFCTAYIYLANMLALEKKRLIALAVICGAFAWFLITAPFAYFQTTNLFVTLGVYVFLLCITHYLLSIRPGIRTKPIQIHYTNKEKILRSLIGGFVIGLIILATKFLGPFWGGIASVFPAVYLSTLLILHWRHGAQFLFHVAKALPIANPVFVIYVFVVAYTYPALGIIVGTVIAYAVSLLYPLILMYVLPNIKNLSDPTGTRRIH